MLYRSIVKTRIRQAFDQVDQRRWDELMTSISPASTIASAASTPSVDVERAQEIDLEAKLFRLTDSDNQACAKGHEGRLADAGPTTLNDHTTTTRRPVLSSTASLKPSHSRQSKGAVS